MQDIDRDIPLPELAFRKGAPDAYPYRQLQIGESFLVHRTTRLSTKRWTEKTGFAFSVRRIALDTWRVWRVRGPNDVEL